MQIKGDSYLQAGATESQKLSAQYWLLRWSQLEIDADRCDLYLGKTRHSFDYRTNTPMAFLIFLRYYSQTAVSICAVDRIVADSPKKSSRWSWLVCQDICLSPANERNTRKLLFRLASPPSIVILPKMENDYLMVPLHSTQPIECRNLDRTASVDITWRRSDTVNRSKTSFQSSNPWNSSRVTWIYRKHRPFSQRTCH